jgi:uncharacterized protein (TIRG00374 family)
MDQRLLRVGMFVVRWAIAIGGIWWVVSQMSLRDSLLVLPEPDALPVRATVPAAAHATDPSFSVTLPDGRTLTVPRGQTVSKPDGNGGTVTLRGSADAPGPTLPLIGIDLANEADDQRAIIRRLLVQEGDRSRFVRPSEVEGGFRLRVPNPRIDTGVLTMVSRANHWLLIAAVAIFPITFILTSIRWHRLLRGLDIHLPLSRVFVLNMVGNFYNSFMPGSTGGDVLKAIYAARQTPHRAAAVMSVIVDRILGLLTLIILGGTMAAVQFVLSPDKHDPTTVACRNVALMSAAILFATVSGVTVLGWPSLRRAIGMDWLLRKLPGQKFIEKILQVLRMYRSRPGLILWAILITFPVHLTVVVSAMLAGKAFDLPVAASYYFVAVPVIVLVGAIPISPQGAGVMEFFANKLLARQGATVSHAFALTMSIRVVQILWNLTGAVFVIRGGFHKPTQAEIDEVERAGDEPDASGASGNPTAVEDPAPPATTRA